MSVHLLGEVGPPDVRSGPNGGATSTYLGFKGPAWVSSKLVVQRLVPGDYTLQDAVANRAKGVRGQVVSAVPVTVAGHPGLDFRIQTTPNSNTPLLMVGRWVQLDARRIAVTFAFGDPSKERTINQVSEFVVGSLRLPR